MDEQRGDQRKTVPASLAIIGGGVVANEMATAYAGFGTTATVISRGGLLDTMEPFAGELVLKSLREQGVTAPEAGAFFEKLNAMNSTLTGLFFEVEDTTIAR